MRGKIFSKLKDYNHILDKMLEEGDIEGWK